MFGCVATVALVAMVLLFFIFFLLICSFCWFCSTQSFLLQRLKHTFELVASMALVEFRRDSYPSIRLNGLNSVNLAKSIVFRKIRKLVLAILLWLPLMAPKRVQRDHTVETIAQGTSIDHRYR